MTTFNTGAYPPGVTQRDIDEASPGYWDDGPDERCDTCRGCDGSGVIGYRITVYEHGCGFPHDDTEERPCAGCGGTGLEVFEKVPVELDDLEALVPA